MAVVMRGGPLVHPAEIRFFLHDPERALRRVALLQAFVRPRDPIPFRRRGEWWRCTLPRPDADRIEYQLVLTGRDGRDEVRTDPSNPLVAAGPFGEKSVVELDAYLPPGWLQTQAQLGAIEPVELRVGRLRTRLTVPVWSAPGLPAGAAAPLLLAHDGPEYAQFALLLRFLEAKVAAGEIPPLRAALLQPVDRNETYSASALYAAALAREIVPALAEAVPHERRIGAGASLGALALLHAHRRHPALFDGLLLQSGSYFRLRSDRQERGFPRFNRISRFVGEVLRGKDPAPVPVAITVGTAEENLANNRAVAAALADQGYEVRFGTVRDAHTWTCWRDAFDPYLTELLR